MNNTEKKLDALIDALGFDVECITVRSGLSPHSSPATINYKLVKRVELKKPVHDVYMDAIIESFNE